MSGRVAWLGSFAVVASVAGLVWLSHTGPGGAAPNVEASDAHEHEHHDTHAAARSPFPAEVPVVPVGPLFPHREEVDRFVVEDVPVASWDATCDDTPPPVAFASLGAVLEDTGLDLEVRIPDPRHIVDFAQFYTLGGSHVQVTAEWNYDQPARYRLRALRFDDEQFTNPRPMPLSDVPEWVEQAALADALEEIDSQMREQSAQRGTRSVVLANHLPSLDEAAEAAEDRGYIVEMRNGTPMRFHGLGVVCHTRGDVATCSCPEGQSRAHKI